MSFISRIHTRDYVSGVPKPESHWITSQEKRAEEMWRWSAGATFTIPPVIVDREYGDLKYQSWPYYCYKAWLTSKTLDPDFLNSQLIVIWFGDEIVTELAFWRRPRRPVAMSSGNSMRTVVDL